MSNRSAMFAAVVANPDDDTTRLVYADAVQEAGDEPLAQLIRVGVLCGCVAGGRLQGVESCYSCGNKGWIHRCQEPECRFAGIPCEIGDLSEFEQPTEFFCGDHASKHGYCGCCGSFWGGIDSFEATGLCDHCRDQLREDESDWGDEFDYRDDEDYEQ